MADLDSLSDAELRNKLSEFNFPAAAITGTTRKIYIKKLKQLMDQSVLNDTAPNRSSSKFSSGESSEDELKKPATRSRKNTPSKVISPVKTTRRRSPGRAAANDVKESDDEEQVASTISHSTSTRPRYYKWSAAENPWWKNSSVVSMSLVGVLAVFFLIIFLFYLNVTRKDAAISSPGF